VLCVLVYDNIDIERKCEVVLCFSMTYRTIILVDYHLFERVRRLISGPKLVIKKQVRAAKGVDVSILVGPRYIIIRALTRL
jgi:hypothetical protein